MFQRQCYIPSLTSINKLGVVFNMGYPKKHRGRRKMGSKKRRARKRNKRKQKLKVNVINEIKRIY